MFQTMTVYYQPKIIKRLLVPNKLLFAVAICWTVAMVALCLVSFRDFPAVPVRSADKLVHALFHFVFTALWFLYFRARSQKGDSFRIAFGIIVMSAIFGAGIELAQELLTVTRTADLLDLVANLCGSLLAAFAMTVYDSIVRK